MFLVCSVLKIKVIGIYHMAMAIQPDFVILMPLAITQSSAIAILFSRQHFLLCLRSNSRVEII